MIPMAPLLEVIVTSAADARAAAEGGADRLELIVEPHLGGMTPAPALVTDVLAASTLPVRVMIRRSESHQVPEETMNLLRDDVESLPMATEFVCGAVTSEGTADPLLERVITAFAGRPWTFHRAVEDAPDLPAMVAAALRLPGCDQVLTAGDPAGVTIGMPVLTSMLADPDVAPGLLIGGGVSLDHVRPLLTAGARGIHLGRVLRGDSSWDRPVEAALVRAAADIVHDH